MSGADALPATGGPLTAAMPSAGVPDWRAVCRLDDIPRLGARRLERAGFVPVAVFRTGDDRIFALLDRCPHKGGPLSQGIVFEQRVACPLHNWSIGLADGCAAAPDQGCTPTVAVRQIEGVVQLDVATWVAQSAAATAGGASAGAHGGVPGSG